MAMNASRRFSGRRGWRLCVCVPLMVLALAAHSAVGEDAAAASKDSATVMDSQSGVTTTGKPEQEFGMEGFASVGHMHIFANSWWSNLYLGGADYYRHSWGHAAGARLDYTAAVLAVVLKQPEMTTVWGNFPPGTPHVYTEGLDIAPIGLRMQWLSKHAVRPYLISRGGLMGTTKKAVSTYGSYLNLSLQIGTGVQFHLSPRWDGQIGWQLFHFSNAFMVPSNPGLDSSGYTCGLNYHLGPRNRE